jgi:hypothetical protein
VPYELINVETIDTVERQTERFRAVNKQIGELLSRNPIDYHELDQLRRRKDILGARLVGLRKEKMSAVLEVVPVEMPATESGERLSA